MTIRSKSELIDNITEDLADNNAGLISAADIRGNMLDIVDSVNYMVASGDFNQETPFRPNNLRVATDNDQDPPVGGILIVESGIRFENDVAGANNTQYVPYPGPGNVSHNDLSDLDVGNPHTQYFSIDGTNLNTENVPFGNGWLNASGNLAENGIVSMDDRGIKFEYTASSSGELIHVGSQSTVKFDIDGSYMASAKGVAQAWVRFVGSGDMAVISSYNVQSIERYDDPGKFRVYFVDNLFADNKYVAIGSSNATTDDGSAEDFDVNTVGIVERDKDYLSFYVRNDAGAYVNAAVNDLVVFGNALGVTADDSATIVTTPAP